MAQIVKLVDASAFTLSNAGIGVKVECTVQYTTDDYLSIDGKLDAAICARLSRMYLQVLP